MFAVCSGLGDVEADPHVVSGVPPPPYAVNQSTLSLLEEIFTNPLSRFARNGVWTYSMKRQADGVLQLVRQQVFAPTESGAFDKRVR